MKGTTNNPNPQKGINSQECQKPSYTAHKVQALVKSIEQRQKIAVQVNQEQREDFEDTSTE
jgi:hypothetical protein